MTYAAYRSQSRWRSPRLRKRKDWRDSNSTTSCNRCRIRCGSRNTAGLWRPELAAASSYNCLMRKTLVLGLLMLIPLVAQRGRTRENATLIVLKPARVFDGETMHEGWMVLVKGDRIEQ